MPKPNALIDGIRRFSPKREKWVAKPARDLPSKVTVTFKTGQTGILDMKNRRAVVWADIINRLQEANRPVYVEIDEESNVITKLLIPRVYKVEALETDERGDVIVRLIESPGIRFLLKTDPGFEAMKNDLQSALDENYEVLITETRDEHEIIDVRLPPYAQGNPTNPPPEPPPDPPVSEARAQELYDDMNAESCDPCNPSGDCITFKYPDNCCHARAQIMCRKMEQVGETPGKVWLFANTVLTVPTLNHPDCEVLWGWHVAPTLDVTISGGTEKRVIDPSLSPAPEPFQQWKDRQGDPNAEHIYTPSAFYWIPEEYLQDEDEDLVVYDPELTGTNYWLAEHRDDLRTRCQDFGPPPYSCIKNCFFIIDRNNFSDDEVEAMLHVSSPAVVEAAFYIVVDGFSPYDLGFTSATMEITPTLNPSPAVSGMTITADRLEFEYPTHLNRRQRLTWVYKISFANTNGFPSEGGPERITVTLDASLDTESSTGYLYLIRQPNPYEIDGERAWLSTDLRVFQIDSGESKFGVTMGSDPSDFITQVIANLNSGNTAGQTFENDISTDQQTSRLELSQSVGGTPVYNFAVAKVRYRSLHTSAEYVRIFFRLFPVHTTSLEYDQSTTYRRHTDGIVIPLLGIKNGEVAAIPCFAAPRINSAAESTTTQEDNPNVMDIPPDTGGAEVVRHFGCWLDINQTQPQFPIQPSPLDGPYTANRKTIQELIRNEHQCLVSEIAFTPAPAQGGSTPSVSDKLAQRNLAIVESANPGLVFSRRIPQTFEIRPSTSKTEHDELMIDWGDIPAGSRATLYLPGFDTNDILLLAAQKYRSHRMVRIDEHTLKFEAGGITYLPIPFADGNFPGMLTVDLPEGIEEGQVFSVVVRQVTGEQQRIRASHAVAKPQPGMRHVVGSFQITIPVRKKAAILPRAERLLSNLRWIERAIPANNRWSPVFSKYVIQIADRVDVLGGDSRKVAASPSGEWRKAYFICCVLGLVTALLIATLVVGAGALTGGLTAIADAPILALLVGAAYLWIKKCRPGVCRLLRTLLVGAGIGTIVLAILAALGITTPQLITTLIVGAGVTVGAAIVGWVKRCFSKRR